MKYGIIANRTAKNGQPSFRGYDLVPKQKQPGYVYSELQDYELVFGGLSAEQSGNVSTDKLLQNLDRSVFQIYQEAIEQEKELAAQDASSEDQTLKVNGEIVKAIVKKDGKYKAELRGDQTDEAQRILQNMLDAFCGARVKRIDMEFAVTTQLRKGTLDIAVKEGREYLVEHTEKGPVILNGNVPTSKVKASIYFMLQPYKYSDKLFLKHINCSHEVNGYVALYEKGKLYFEKKGGSFNDLERAIAKDLIKAKV